MTRKGFGNRTTGGNQKLSPLGDSDTFVVSPRFAINRNRLVVRYTRGRSTTHLRGEGHPALLIIPLVLVEYQVPASQLKYVSVLVDDGAVRCCREFKGITIDHYRAELKPPPKLRLWFSCFEKSIDTQQREGEGDRQGERERVNGESWQ